PADRDGAGPGIFAVVELHHRHTDLAQRAVHEPGVDLFLEVAVAVGNAGAAIEHRHRPDQAPAVSGDRADLEVIGAIGEADLTARLRLAQSLGRDERRGLEALLQVVEEVRAQRRVRTRLALVDARRQVVCGQHLVDQRLARLAAGPLHAELALDLLHRGLGGRVERAVGAGLDAQRRHEPLQLAHAVARVAGAEAGLRRGRAACGLGRLGFADGLLAALLGLVALHRVGELGEELGCSDTGLRHAQALLRGTDRRLGLAAQLTVDAVLVGPELAQVQAQRLQQPLKVLDALAAGAATQIP